MLISRIAVFLAGLFLAYGAMDKTADIGNRRVNGFLGGVLIVGTIAQWILGSLLYKAKNSIGDWATLVIILAACLLIAVTVVKLGRSGRNNEVSK